MGSFRDCQILSVSMFTTVHKIILSKYAGIFTPYKHAKRLKNFSFNFTFIDKDSFDQEVLPSHSDSNWCSWSGLTEPIVFELFKNYKMS